MTADSYEWHHGPDAEQRGTTARQEGFGSFEAARITDPGQDTGRGPIRVSRADPRILISDLMMDMIRGGYTDGCELDGDLLRFTAVNGTWTYRIGERLEDRRARIAELADFSQEQQS